MRYLKSSRGTADIEAEIESMIAYDSGKEHFTNHDDPVFGAVVSVQYFETGGHDGRPVDNFIEVRFGDYKHEQRYAVEHGNFRCSMDRVVQQVARDVWHWLLGEEIEEGDVIDKLINQGVRECEVIKINRTRCRLAYEMPNAGDYGGWYPIVKIAGKTILKNERL